MSDFRGAVPCRPVDSAPPGPPRATRPPGLAPIWSHCGSTKQHESEQILLSPSPLSDGLCPTVNKAIVLEVVDFVVSLEAGWRVVGEAV